jgi:hypothetical protein
MADRSLSCLRCSGSMEAGIILDAGAYGALDVGKWVEGAPVRSIWTGLKVAGKDKLDVTTYRCRRCGYLESYA